jgi:hypothetical protein
MPSGGPHVCRLPRSSLARRQGTSCPKILCLPGNRGEGREGVCSGINEQGSGRMANLGSHVYATSMNILFWSVTRPPLSPSLPTCTSLLPLLPASMMAPPLSPLHASLSFGPCPAQNWSASTTKPPFEAMYVRHWPVAMSGTSTYLHSSATAVLIGDACMRSCVSTCTHASHA